MIQTDSQTGEEMERIVLASPVRYSQLTIGELREVLDKVHRLLAKELAAGGEIWDNHELRISVFEPQLRLYKLPFIERNGPDVRLVRNLDPDLVRDLGFNPTMATRVFYTVLPEAVAKAPLGGYFEAMVYDLESGLLLSLLEMNSTPSPALYRGSAVCRSTSSMLSCRPTACVTSGS